jgi:sugar/nucleoside kinase (ribokinase family)
MTTTPASGAPGRVDAVFVGVATLDAIALVDGFPAPDDRVIASEVVYAGGGPAATAAVAAARLGVRSAFVGTVGDDDNGRAILAGLEAEGVDVRGVTVAPGQASAASVVVVDRVRDSRAICNRPAPRIDIGAGLDLIAAAPVVHVDHAGWAPVAASGVLETNQLLSVDAGNPIPGFSAQGVGLYVPTVEALRRRYDPTRPVADLLALAVADGAAVVVATDGARGSSALTATGESAFAPAHTVSIHSTLGAGDVFHGALVAAVVRGLPLAGQLAFANVTAALSCRGLDGRSQIPSLAEVEAAMPANAH